MSEPLIPKKDTTTTTTTSQHHRQWSLPSYQPLVYQEPSQKQSQPQSQQPSQDLRQRRKSRSGRSSRTSSGGSISSSQNQHHHGSHPPHRRTRRRSRHSVLKRAGSTVFLPRIIPRDLPFHQSSNMVQVRNDQQQLLWRLMVIDWFHTLLRLRPSLSVSFLLTLWVLAVVVFAGLYMTIDRHYHGQSCGLGTIDSPIAFSSAVAFSLETCTTVGYSLPGDSNAFFESNCHGLQVVIFFQMIWSMMFNAFMFAFFFSLLSKSEFRSTQIIFTNRLLITSSQTSDKTDDSYDDEDDDDENDNENQNGQVYCRLQCYDIDSAYPLVESHARMYLLDHQLKLHPLRLSEPNDDMGGMLYPSVPADIVHGIDRYSALCPPECRQDNPLVWPGKKKKTKKNSKGASSSGSTDGGNDTANETNEDVDGGIEGKIQQQSYRQRQHRLQQRRRRQTHHPGVVLRSVDGVTGNRDDYVCPVCGESYGTYSRLKAHVEHSALAESHDNFPPDHPRCHIGYVVPEKKPITLDMVRSHLERTLSEIVVVVEAIDPQLSGTFQSLQSYKFEDIVFGKSVEYAKCMFVRNNTFTVDMNKFHTVENYDSDENDDDNDENDNDDDDSDMSEIGSSGGGNDTATALAAWKRSLRPARTISNISHGGDDDDDDDDGDDDDDDPHALEIGGHALPKTYKTFQG